MYYPRRLASKPQFQLMENVRENVAAYNALNYKRQWGSQTLPVAIRLTELTDINNIPQRSYDKKFLDLGLFVAVDSKALAYSQAGITQLTLYALTKRGRNIRDFFMDNLKEIEDMKNNIKVKV